MYVNVGTAENGIAADAIGEHEATAKTSNICLHILFRIIGLNWIICNVIKSRPICK